MFKTYYFHTIKSPKGDFVNCISTERFSSEVMRMLDDGWVIINFEKISKNEYKFLKKILYS